MQVYALLELAVFAAVVSATVRGQVLDTSNSSSEARVTLYEIPECTTTQLNAAETVLTTESNTLKCERLFNIKSGMLLQSADLADALCGEQSCLNALRMLFHTLPNCRYELWGLKYSASKFLNHCGIATNTTSLM